MSTKPSERRKHRRHQILEGFSFFVVVPQKGFLKLKLEDISMQGIGFHLTFPGETIAEKSDVKIGDSIEVLLYVNRSLSIPISVKVARVEQTKEMLKIGGQVHHAQTETERAYLALIEFLGALENMNGGAER